MPSKETQELLDRLERLTREARVAEAMENPRFEEAVRTLDEMAGRRPKGRGSTFEDAVWRVLSAISDAVVSREPHTRRSPFRPDFLVTVDNHKVLVEAKAPSQALPALTRQLDAALDAYGADEALVVVPQGGAPGEVAGVANARVRVLEMGDLLSFFADLSRR